MWPAPLFGWSETHNIIFKIKSMTAHSFDIYHLYVENKYYHVSDNKYASL